MSFAASDHAAPVNPSEKEVGWLGLLGWDSRRPTRAGARSSSCRFYRALHRPKDASRQLLGDPFTDRTARNQDSFTPGFDGDVPAVARQARPSNFDSICQGQELSFQPRKPTFVFSTAYPVQVANLRAKLDRSEEP